MPRRWTDTYSFTRGTALNLAQGFLVIVKDALAKDRRPHAICAMYNNDEWHEAGMAGWMAVGVCAVKDEMVAVGETGGVLTLAGGTMGQEQIATKEQPSYAAGMGRQVWRREGPRQWVAIDQGCRRAQPDGTPVGFEAIDGTSEKDLWAVGWQGEIWHCDGQAWRQIDSPSNGVLANVCCGGDGAVYACGRRGLLLRGRQGAWEAIEHESTIEDLWGLAWFADRLWLASTRALYTLDGDGLRLYGFDDDTPATCYHLSAAGGALWSIGAKDVLAFDGTTWTRID